MTLQEKQEKEWNDKFVWGKTNCQDVIYFIKKIRKEIIQQERQRILSLAENIFEKEMRAYGTDKHGISLEQIKNMLKYK